MTLSGKTALVTGAGRDIGKGCAVELACAGADIVLNDRPESPDIESAAEEIRSLGRKCHVITADVFSRTGCEQLVGAALKAVPKIDILISNPAFSRRGAFLDYPPELFEETIRGTLTSGYHLSQLVARHMVERADGGKIVFISSVQAQIPSALCFAYGAAKAGLNHMMRSIAVELSDYRINVNAIEPGCNPSPVDGFFEPHVQLGQEVRTGTVLGTVVPMKDDSSHLIKCRHTGVVLMLRTFPRVRAGESVGVVLETDVA